MNASTGIFIFLGKRSFDAEPEEYGPSEAGPDPSAPITRRGVFTSFLTGKAMDIPEQDVVTIQSNIREYFSCTQCFSNNLLHTK